MGIDRTKLTWSLRKIHHDEGESGDWGSCPATTPITYSLLVYYDQNKVVCFNDKERVFHCMHAFASTSGETSEVAMFGYYENDKCFLVCLNEAGVVVDNALWEEADPERFKSFVKVLV